MEIKDIEELVRKTVEPIEINGRKYSAESLSPIITPYPATVTVHNLRGFCDFIKNDIDKKIKGKPGLIVINDPKSVELISALDNEARRTVLISAHISPKISLFPFGSFMEQEKFVILFRSMFLESADFDYVLNYVSKIVDNTIIEDEDDGITQTVTVKKGTSGALKDKATLKPIVSLKPFRSFVEAEQVESEFLLRINKQSGGTPTIALFEADGGAWINQATENVAEYIRREIVDIPVIA